MRLVQGAFLSVAILGAVSVGSASDETLSGSTMTWKCPEADGSWMYTNKERAGCQAMSLKPLSIVPNLENIPAIPQPSTVAAPHYQVSPYQDRAVGFGGQPVPDWARDWHAGIAPSSSAQEEVCSLYSEWMHLVQKTRGGMFYGTDPSYGGDITGRNLRGASNSFYDNTRYIALSRLFGTGFVPVGCF